MIFPILYGDMFNYQFHAYVNTVNCVGVMGKGLALHFKNRFPDMFKEYKRRCETGIIVPGKMDIHHHDNIVIVNFPTKLDWKHP